MAIVLYLGRNIKEYEEKSSEIIEWHMGNVGILCKLCLRPMSAHSSYWRGIKEMGERIEITMVWCRACKEWHSLLPDFLLPRKHYSGNEIESVIIDSATEPAKLIETKASESTVRRWVSQISERIRQAVNILKHQFGRGGQAVSEVLIDAGPAYSELEQVLEMAPQAVKCSGNKLGLANIWLGANDVPAHI